jgi:DNA-binding XRE family transcriptional regulator
MTFIEYVKHVRTELGMSQHKFAKEIKINFTTLNRWENEHIVPSRLARKSFFEYCRIKGFDIPIEVYEENELPFIAHIVAGKFVAFGVASQTDYQSGFFIHEPTLRIGTVRFLCASEAHCSCDLEVMLAVYRNDIVRHRLAELGAVRYRGGFEIACHFLTPFELTRSQVGP